MRFNFSVIFLAAFCLHSAETALAQNSGKRQGGSYICSANGALWNQSRPCNEQTPERELMLKRIGSGAATERKGTFDLSLLEQKPVDAALGQTINFPERFVGQAVRLKDISIWGKISRDSENNLKPGFQSTAIISDKFKRTLMVAIPDQVGLNLSAELNPGLKYPLSYAILNIERNDTGYVAYLAKYSFADESAQKMNSFDQAPTSPIFEFGKSARGSNPDTAQAPHELEGDSTTAASQIAPGNTGNDAPSESSINKLLESLSAGKQVESPAEPEKGPVEEKRKFGEIKFKDIEFSE